MIQSLIDKFDNNEVIRDQIAAILCQETRAQQKSARDADRDPTPWAFKVYQERSHPLEAFQNDDADTTPIVNVWYESSNFDKSRSNSIERQAAEATINVDCYAVGHSLETSPGFIPGDQQAAENVQRVVRLVRNIIMASDYTYLGLRGLVAQRWINSTTIFQGPSGGNTVQSVIGARVSLVVHFNEFSPQYEPHNLEYLSVTVKRLETGEIIAKTDYDYGDK